MAKNAITIMGGNIMEGNFVITVARGFGTGGKQIASAIANQLGIHCYENRILTLASQMTGFDEAEYMALDEKLRGGIFSAKLAKLSRSLTPKPMQSKFKGDDQLFEDQAMIIRSLAENESCVIVGKCADYILKDYDNVLSVYIEAPRSFCVKRIVAKMNCSEEEAHKMITKTDKYRADYYKYYTHGNYWTNPVNYDLTLNNGRLGNEKCIKIILDALETKLGVSTAKE